MNILRLVLASIIGGIAFGSIAAAGAEFTDSQRTEIEALVKDYLMNNPEVIRDAIRELERRQDEAESQAQQFAIKENATAIYRTEHDLVGGNPDGKVSIVEFFDYNCGYCKRALKDVMTMIETDKDIRLVMKELPILGPGSLYAARAAFASRAQGKYWDFHLAMLGHDGRIDEATVNEIAEASGLNLEQLHKDMDSAAVSEAIQKNMQLAEALKINGTPAFVIDQTLIPGAVGYDALAAAVDKVRKAGGCQVC